METNKTINFILIIKAYLIRKAMAELLLEEYPLLQQYDDISDFDFLLSLAGKSQSSCIIMDTNSMKKFERYLHKLPASSVVIPIAEGTKNIEKFESYKTIITLDDDKRKILETVHRASGSIKIAHPPAKNSSELTGREALILQYIAGGCSSRVIADRLNISIQTVSTHRKNISAKLGIKSVSGLTVYAIINNLIKPEETGLN